MDVKWLKWTVYFLTHMLNLNVFNWLENSFLIKIQINTFLFKNKDVFVLR